LISALRHVRLDLAGPETGRQVWVTTPAISSRLSPPPVTFNLYAEAVMLSENSIETITRIASSKKLVRVIRKKIMKQITFIVFYKISIFYSAFYF
jgi:hypothetical protein